MGSRSVVAHETGKLDSMGFATGVVADLDLPLTPAACFEDGGAPAAGVMEAAERL